MKKLFLYAVRDTALFRHLEQYLGQMTTLFQLVTLPPGSHFTSPLCLELRSSDPIILYAETDNDLQALLESREEYDCFKIILVMRAGEVGTGNKSRLLTPRMIFYLDSDLTNLNYYLQYLFRNTSN